MSSANDCSVFTGLSINLNSPVSPREKNSGCVKTGDLKIASCMFNHYESDHHVLTGYSYFHRMIRCGNCGRMVCRKCQNREAGGHQLRKVIGDDDRRYVNGNERVGRRR